MAKENLVTTIDLTEGTPDKIRDIFGKEQTVDLYWDEVNKKVCGTSTTEKGTVRVTHEILDGRLVQSFTTEKHSLVDKSPVEIKIISEPEGKLKKITKCRFTIDTILIQDIGRLLILTAIGQWSR